MKSEKQQAIELIDQMPGTVSTETIIAALQFRATMLRRGAELDVERRTVSHEEAKRRLEPWLKSVSL